MTQTLEERIERLERELALKNAYLSVQFSFPKNSKLPEDVKTQVTEELKKACAQLAEDKEVVTEVNSASAFTTEEVSILKQVVQAATSKIKPSKLTPTEQVETAKIARDDQKPEAREAVLTSLDHVPQHIRNKMGSNETVLVRENKEGIAYVLNRAGHTFRVPLEDLDFNL